MRKLIPLAVLTSLLLWWAHVSQATDGVSAAAISGLRETRSGMQVLVNANAFVEAISVIVNHHTGDRFMKACVNTKKDSFLQPSWLLPGSIHHTWRSQGSSIRSGTDGKKMDVWLSQKENSRGLQYSLLENVASSLSNMEKGCYT
jgi:hypothetical protein